MASERSKNTSANERSEINTRWNSGVSRSASTGDLEKLEQRFRNLDIDSSTGRLSCGKQKRSSPVAVSKSYSPKNSLRKKFKWYDPTSRCSLTAGGILFYDEKGVWVIGEKDKNGVVYTDIGGRYTYEDGNIWSTIARELREETYGICELFAKEVEGLSKVYPPVYVNGHENIPVYVCLVIPVSALELEKRRNFSLDPVAFDVQRRKTLVENPDVPEEYYCPCVLTKLSYEELKSPEFRLSYRLKRVLKFSTILSAIPRQPERSSCDIESESVCD